MGSYKHYENNFSKYAGSSNQFKAPKSMIKEKEHSEKWKENSIGNDCKLCVEKQINPPDLQTRRISRRIFKRSSEPTQSIPL